MIQFLKDGKELSMRRLVAAWGMSLLSILSVSTLFGATIDTQIFNIIGGITTIAIGSTAIKNKSEKD